MAKHLRQHITNKNHKNINNRHTKMVIINSSLCRIAFECIRMGDSVCAMEIPCASKANKMKKNTKIANDFRKNKTTKNLHHSNKMPFNFLLRGSVFVRGNRYVAIFSRTITGCGWCRSINHLTVQHTNTASNR